ncbi:uncharacterized protein LOC143018787 [Oratosquilla oratoria]|uniref:uncharacterized protein LOC143018787 n=1 Tax=Oratosquilla oratoria TaxID=337810 RepID=UPI003F760B0E
MEYEGLNRSLNFLVNVRNVIVGALVTGLHSQIKKYRKTKWADIKHWFYCWHVVKGSKAHKELELVVMQKELLRVIDQLSPCQQTSALESYLKDVCFFAPKSQHFMKQ